MKISLNLFDIYVLIKTRNFRGCGNYRIKKIIGGKNENTKNSIANLH